MRLLRHRQHRVPYVVVGALECANGHVFGTGDATAPVRDQHGFVIVAGDICPRCLEEPLEHSVEWR